MIFLIRFLTATCLFALLGKANIWLTPSSHAALVVSYRTLLIFSPVFTRYAGYNAILVALISAILGIALFHVQAPWLWIIAALLTGLGLSVAGYLIKATAAETTTGAAYNKIAVNAGSLLAGIILLFPYLSRTEFLIYCLLGMILCCISMFFHNNIRSFSTKSTQSINQPKPALSLQCAWGCVGMVIGIKLFGVFAVLPQYLLNTHQQLPTWYGITVFLSSLIIILLQLPIIKLLSYWIKRFNQPSLPFFILLIGMLLIATPQYFYAHTLPGAITWTVLLAIIECCASYLDVQSSRDGTLLIKETAVGIGGGMTVLLARFLPADIASLVVGIFGIILLMTALWFFTWKKTEKII